MRRLPILAILIGALIWISGSVAHAQNQFGGTWTSTVNTPFSGALPGGTTFTVGIIAADDTSPNVSLANIWTTAINTVPTAITTLDGESIGEYLMLCGGSNTNATTIASGGQFSGINGTVTLTTDECITLWVQADNDYIVLSRNETMDQYFSATSVYGNLLVDDTTTGVAADSPNFFMRGNHWTGAADVEIEGLIYLDEGTADPYLSFGVDDDGATPLLVEVFRVYNDAILFPTDNAVDIGAAGATRPKDIHAAGTVYTVGANVSGTLTLADGANLTQSDTSTAGVEVAILATPSGARTAHVVTITGAGTNFSAGAALVRLDTGTDVDLTAVILDVPSTGILAQIEEGAVNIWDFISTTSSLTLEAVGDIAAGNGFSVTSTAAGELTAAAGTQSFMQVDATINQSGTGGYMGLEVNVDETATGTGIADIFAARRTSTTQFAIESDGDIRIGSAEAGKDYTITVDGETSDGTWRWDEDLSYWTGSNLGGIGVIAANDFTVGRGLNSNVGGLYLNTNDPCVSIYTTDSGKNSIVITETAYKNSNHDHSVLSDTPIVFNHSDENPDNSNSEYGSFTHNGADQVYSAGFGGYSWGVDDQPARGTMTITGDVTLNETFVINVTTFTAKAAEAIGSDEFLRTGTVTEIADSIVAVINGGSEGANANAWNTAGVITVEWLTKGVAGNAIVYTEACTNMAITPIAGTLGGAVDAAVLMTLPETGVPVFTTYTRHHDMPIGAATLGAAAVTFATIGTYRCAILDANADLIYYLVEVPSEWDGASNMSVEFQFFTQSGDALANGEIIELHVEYRSVDIAGGETYDNGTAVTVLPSVTGGAAETDKGGYDISAALVYTGGNQPLTAGDFLGFKVFRDVSVTDTYSGEVYMCDTNLEYQAIRLGTH